MYFGNNRKYLIILNVAIFVLVLGISLSYWNDAKKDGWVLSLVFFVLYIVLHAYTILITFRLIDEQVLGKHIAQLIDKEKQAIYNKIEEEKLKEQEEQVEQVDNTEDLLNEIIPKGAYKKINTYSSKLLSALVDKTEAIVGIMYVKDKENDEYTPVSRFAIDESKEISSFKNDESLAGQVVVSKELAIVEDIPDTYFIGESGLGKTKPKE
ncbi:MAG: hypothetical protein MI922_23220, partial [Bacteroidales bacterium]|nr:hypothetical protein [Bacteroidales bacterium]